MIPGHMWLTSRFKKRITRCDDLTLIMPSIVFIPFSPGDT
jgi:hypothetical protein